MLAVHYVLPFVVAVLVIVHIVLLHSQGSGTPQVLAVSNCEHDAFGLYYYKDACSQAAPQ